MAEVSPFRYRAFLSYSHRDTAWGKWLHAALEGYRVDKDLIGRETPAGPVPRTLRPIFRDREDFSAGHSLTEQTQAALQSSQFLIVLCSPNAARSIYVDEEIRRYKAAGRRDHVIPIIVDGEPGDPERECFPPALRFKIGPDGALTDEREEPIAADARPQGDGKDGAKLKLVAGLLGVGLDEIVRRAEQARRRRLRKAVAVLTLLTLMFAGIAGYAEIQRRHAVTSLNAATKTSNDIIYDLAMRFRTQRGVPSELVRDILDRARKLQDVLTASGQTSPILQHSQAAVLLETALTLQSIGERAGALEVADRARQIFEDLLAQNPHDGVLQLELGVAYQRMGDSLATTGETAQALNAFEKARALHATRVAADPSDDKAQRNLSVDYTGIGDLLGTGGKLDEALAAFRKSLEIMRVLVQRNEENATWWRDLGIAHERVGNVLVQQRKLDEALVAFRERLAIAQKLAENDPNNTQFQRDLSVAYNKIGDVLRMQDKVDEALGAYEKILTVRKKLAASDPTNASWQRDLAISHNLIGSALASMGKFEEALAALQQALPILQRLVAQDQRNMLWQDDLCFTFINIGRLLMERDRLDAAFGSFRDGLAIAAAQTKANPKNVNWQRRLQSGVTQVAVLSSLFTLSKDFVQGLQSAEAAMSLAPDMIRLQSNRANALMFLDRTDEARAVYLQYRGRKNVVAQQSWEEVVLADFALLRKSGLGNPLMDEIERQFSGGG